MKASTRMQPPPWQTGAVLDTLVARFAHFLVVLCSKYGRSIAAERRYQELRHTNTLTARTRVTSADLPRHVFDEFYAS
jgi:hypothetical protein